MGDKYLRDTEQEILYGIDGTPLTDFTQGESNMALDFTALTTAVSNLTVAINNVKDKVIILEAGQVTPEDQMVVNGFATSVNAAIATLNEILEGSSGV